MPGFRVAASYSFACGLATIAIPHEWELVAQTFNEATFAPPDGGRVTVKAMAYEQPEAIRRGAYEEFIWDVFSREDFESMRPGFQQWWEHENDAMLTLSLHDTADDGTYFRNFWRTIQVRRPDIVRKLDWRFEPAALTDGEGLAVFTESLDEFVQETRFAVDETELDRVAPSTALKLVPFGHSVLMRMPFDWMRERENPDGTGRHVIEEPEGRDRWTLWIDWEEFEVGDTPGADEKAAREIREMLLSRPSATAVPGLDGAPVIVQDEHVDDEDEPLRIFTWHRVVPRGESIVMAHFAFVASADKVDEPEVRQARELVGREAARAILMPSDWTLREDDD